MSEPKFDLENLRDSINGLIQELSDLQDMVAQRRTFARLKLFLLLDFWDMQLLEALSEHFQEINNTLERCRHFIQRYIDDTPKAQLYLNLIDNAPSLTTQLNALTKLASSNFPTKLLPTLRLASIDPDEPDHVKLLADLWRESQSKKNPGLWQKVEEFLRITGMNAQVVPGHRLELENFFGPWPRTIQRPEKTSEIVFVQLSPVSQDNSPRNRSVATPRPYIVLYGDEQQTATLKYLFDSLGQSWPDEYKSLVSELTPLVIEALNTNFRSPPANRLCAALDKIYHACRDHGRKNRELCNLFKWWHRFIQTFFRLEILPQVKDYSKLELHVPVDKIRSLPEDKVHLEPVITSLQPAGTVLQLDHFWCDKISPSKPLNWTVSAGNCPQSILTVAELPVDKSWMCDELIQWVTAARQLRFIDTHRERDFIEACKKLRDSIKVAKHDSRILHNLNELFRCASRDSQALRMPPDKAQAWLDLLRECAHIDLDPRIETGEEARCNTELWKKTQSRELPPAVEARFDDVLKGYVISCDFASVDPQNSRYTVSLGPREEAPPWLQYSWALYEKSEHNKTSLPGDLVGRCRSLFRRESYVFLTGHNENPLTGQDLKQILEHIIAVRPSNPSLASELFSLFRDYVRTRNWTIQPEDYVLTQFFRDLSENARKSIEKYDFDDAQPMGYITPRIDSIDNTKRIVNLKLRVSVGEPPEDFEAIRKIVNKNPAFDVLRDLVENAAERFKEIPSDKALDPRDIWVKWFLELYEKLTDEFPEEGPQRDLDEDTRKQLETLRSHVDKLARSLSLDFWKPADISEARPGERVTVEHEEIGANSFFVRRRAVKDGDKFFLSSRIYKYRTH